MVGARRDLCGRQLKGWVQAGVGGDSEVGWAKRGGVLRLWENERGASACWREYFLGTYCVLRPAVTAPLIFAITIATIGSFQFGYNTGIINAPEMIIKDFLNYTLEG